MNWSRTAQYVFDILALFLIIRLAAIRARLPGVYHVFVAFVGFQLLDSLVSLALYALYSKYAFYRELHLDYRLFWMPLQIVSWLLSLWMVYALLSELLKSLPGILRFSRVLLNVIFAVAILLALLTVLPEYTAAGGAHYPDLIDRALTAVFVVNRAVAMAALLALVCILAFILWFPVEMHRNLAVFSVGLVIYFTSRVALLLARSYLSHENTRLLSTTMTLVLAACFAYWILFITPHGQAVQVRWGHSWRLDEQRRLVTQLESMNTALLRSAARR
jgi:hypothetical protein